LALGVLITSAVHAILQSWCNESFTQNAEEQNGKAYIPLEYIFQNVKTTIPDWHLFQTKQIISKLE
jgi:hypothetical protein